VVSALLEGVKWTFTVRDTGEWPFADAIFSGQDAAVLHPAPDDAVVNRLPHVSAVVARYGMEEFPLVDVYDLSGAPKFAGTPRPAPCLTVITTCGGVRIRAGRSRRDRFDGIGCVGSRSRTSGLACQASGVAARRIPDRGFARAEVAGADGARVVSAQLEPASSGRHEESCRPGRVLT
jgi:hypothetical protein